MTDRELHCRGKANEARMTARSAKRLAVQSAYLALADRWDREAERAAVEA